MSTDLNLVPSVSHPTAPLERTLRGGKMRDPGNEVARIHGVNKAGAHRARAIPSFVLSDVLEYVVKNESEAELSGRHLSCSQGASCEQ